ncbi:hypothetical protein DCS_06685 [Drechmeria coniospora]|uniref:Uncharacterized protein n=1 Tax=Drechmeria coniospora TaxID=98403 RepID=A0A151GCF0_DRECN|nr:hypothetical protein DCS_06685 [Drechmeria coniospora]KYK54725.1 hypothetical protein DCS_06685 [Drechmeria coniospora]
MRAQERCAGSSEPTHGCVAAWLRGTRGRPAAAYDWLRVAYVDLAEHDDDDGDDDDSDDDDADDDDADDDDADDDDADDDDDAADDDAAAAAAPVDGDDSGSMSTYESPPSSPWSGCQRTKRQQRGRSCNTSAQHARQRP